MKKEINDLLIKMQTGQNCIGETADRLMDLFESTDQKEIKVGDVMEVIREFSGHEFKIGTHVTIETIRSMDYTCRCSKGEYWYLDAAELSHIKTETK